MRDPFDANIMGHLAEEISGPLSASLEVQSRDLGANGTFDLAAPLREGAILVKLKHAPDDSELSIEARITAPAPQRKLASLQFDRWSEIGTALPLWVEPANPATEMMDPVRISIHAKRDGTPIPREQLSRWFEIQLLSGRTAKLLYVLQAESANIRRHMHSIKASRSIDQARGEALDRHGSDLGVPRFRTGLSLEESGQVRTVRELEGDREYRQRLKLVRAMSLPRPARYAMLGDERGPLSHFGPSVPVSITENDNPFSAAISVVAIAKSEAAAGKMRQNFLQFLDDWILINPKKTLPSRRRMTTEAKGRERRQRALLEGLFSSNLTDIPMAPDLADCFERLAMLMKGLGISGQIDPIESFSATQTSSRYELGMGVAIRQPTAVLQRLAASLENPPDLDDRALMALISLIEVPANLGTDPLGKWLLEPCGFQTVYQRQSDVLFLSHTSVQSLEVIGDRQKALTTADVTIDFSARFVPSGGGAGTQLFNELLTETLKAFQGASRVSNPTAMLGEARPFSAAQVRRLRAAGLSEIEDWDAIQRQVDGLPPGQWGIVKFSNAFTTNLRNARATAWRLVENALATLRENGLAAATPFFTPSAAGLLISVISLPKIGFNMAGKAATGVRWLVVPLGKQAAEASTKRGISKILRPSGFETSIQFREQGLYAVVALGFERRGDTDPFEIRAIPEDDGDVLTYAQFEYLMNFLSLRSPIGVEVNTWQLRQFHVVSDGGQRVPLDVAASRSFRRYRNPAQAGSKPSTPPITQRG